MLIKKFKTFAYKSLKLVNFNLKEFRLEIQMEN